MRSDESQWFYIRRNHFPWRDYFSLLQALDANDAKISSRLKIALGLWRDENFNSAIEDALFERGSKFGPGAMMIHMRLMAEMTATLGYKGKHHHFDSMFRLLLLSSLDLAKIFIQRNPECLRRKIVSLAMEQFYD